MRIIRLLITKELKSYFFTPFGWIVLAFVSIMQGLSLSSAMKGFKDKAVVDSMVYVAFHTPHFWFYFLFIFPLITMRLFAEEEKNKTLEALLTAPIHSWQVVVSKYIAAMVFYMVLWVPCVVQFFIFESTTGLNMAWHSGVLVGTFTIILLMGVAFTALGCLASALTSSQIIAGILTIALLVFQYFLGFVTVIWGSNFKGASFFEYISSQSHLSLFSRGLIDSRPFIYYISLSVLVLFLTYQIIDYRRWRQ